ncbi:thioredoxin family protein [Streptococcus entericus]|uniref:thioredoxin family protein n=1 Tax=Streptococcus entericus TaxID=155680 RepID=UPI00035C309F|nr:thioredoxin family protein [Streptococcus entericus]
MKKASSINEISQLVNSDQKVVFLFTADWCGDCQFIYPVLDELVADFPQLTFLQVDRDQFMDLAKQWDVFGIPSLVVTQGGQEIGRLVNRLRKTKQEISQFLQTI